MVTLIIALSSIGMVSLVQQANPATVHALALNDNRLVVAGADTFDDTGIYICRRPDEKQTGESFYGSITKTFGDNVQNFEPECLMIVKDHDVWQELPVNNGYFSIELSSDKCSVMWTLQEAAPAAVYGVKCIYTDSVYSDITHEDIYQIVYTDTWNYVSVKDADNQTYITNFVGGSRRRLNLYVEYNAGATVLSVLQDGKMLPNQVRYGRIMSAGIITTENLTVSLSTIGGELYTGRIYTDVTGNILTVIFDDVLANDIYIMKLSSTLDDKVYGQFVIDNSALTRGINLSQFWVLVVILGGILVLFGVLAFFVPLLVIKVNQWRVNRENVRVAKMKNPEAYADSEGNLLQRVQKNLKKLRKGGAKTEEKVVEKPKVENPSESVRITNIISQNRENRRLVEENAISGGKAEAVKQQEAIDQNAQKHSFAFLRDDDDEIASLQDDSEAMPTIETGSYVQDGVTFAKLDSMKDEDDDQQ